MCEITVKLDCPHCFDSKVVKNGRKGNGRQNYLCKKCGKQFQHEYVYWGCKMDYKRLIIGMLLNGNGIRDIVKTLSVSMGCVLRTLVKCGENIVIKLSKQHYHKVQIDELYSFVKNKGKKVWILYAYDAETDEIL